MQDTSRLIINHIRIMIEEAERTKTEIKVSVCVYVCMYVCMYVYLYIYRIASNYGQSRINARSRLVTLV